MEHWGRPGSKALEFLIAPEKPEQFMKDAWEKGPKVYKATEEKQKAFDGLFDRGSLDQIMKQREGPDGDGPLQFTLDLNAARYVNGVRETPNGEVGDAKTVWGLFKDGCTLQFLQPQRFREDLQALCASLESELGCLVGCNAYITPKGTQGLAPHHDDVELFVCQTEGSKTWRLYSPLDGYALPSQPSGNLEQSAIGDPIMEVTLNVGDVLYMPKGTIHQAVAQKEHSVHLTISTYQRWSWGDLACSILHNAVAAKDAKMGPPLSLREGLPHGMLTMAGRHTGTKQSVGSVCKDLAGRLRELADMLEENHELVGAAVDGMAEDFITCRMPPLDSQLPDKGPCPTLRDSVRPRGEGLFRLTTLETDSGEPDNRYIQLVTCYTNPVKSHMIAVPEADSDLEDLLLDEHGESGDESDELESPVLEANGHGRGKGGSSSGQNGDGVDNECASDSESGESNVLLFPAEYDVALKQILNSGEEGVAVKKLQLESDKDKIECVKCMWEDGVVVTVGGGNAKEDRHSKRSRKK